MTMYKWSQTAASNATADATINWAEGMPPSAVNDSSRAVMAAAAKFRDDMAGSLTTAGTSTAYTLTSNQVFDSLANMSGKSIRVKIHTVNGASPTLNVDSLGAKAIVTVTGTAVGTAALLANTIYDLVYSNSSSEWILIGGASPLAGFASGTVMLFVQTAAPTGWTKGSTHDNKALRLVTGTPGTGGSAPFTSVFTSRLIGQINLPSYTLPNTLGGTADNAGGIYVGTGTANSVAQGGAVNNVPNGATSPSPTTLSLTITGSVTSGGSGTALDFAVQYVDCILATKD